MRWLVISRQRVLIHKENKVEMPTIKATMNYKNVGDNSKDKEKKFSTGLLGPLATPAFSILHCLQIPACSESQRWLMSWWTKLLLSCLWYPKRGSFLLFPFSVSVSSLSSSFLHLLLLCSADFICRKNGVKTESLPYFFLVSPIFFSSFLFYSFSSTACLPDLIATQGWRKKLPLFYAFFFSRNCLPLLCFLSFFFCFSMLCFAPFSLLFLGH